jgi:hypothetical protein
MKVIYIAILDIKPGEDDEMYEAVERLKPSASVTPLLIGRIFEEYDIILLIHTDSMESLDDYLIKNVRKYAATQELVVVPVYEFSTLPSFDSLVEIDVDEKVSEEPEVGFAPDDDYMMLMAKIDVAPQMDKAVHDAVMRLSKDEDVIPLMTGHTFHSKEFDMVLFFLSNELEAAWQFGKYLRSIEGVWDTQFDIIAHFEPLVPLGEFRRYIASKQGQE